MDMVQRQILTSPQSVTANETAGTFTVNLTLGSGLNLLYNSIWEPIAIDITLSFGAS